MNVLVTMSTVLALAATTLGWVFVWDYSRESWQETEAGRHIMRFTAGLAIIMTWLLVSLGLRLWFGLPDWLEVVLAVGRVCIFGWLATMLWTRWRLLRSNRRQRRTMDTGRGSATGQPTTSMEGTEP